MYGFAEFKSHVLRRDEKGMFGIPFKRLLGCGMGGGAIMTVAKIPFPEWSIPIGFVSVIVLLILTAPRGGIPRWKYFIYGWRWRLMTAVVMAPGSVLGSIGKSLQLPVEALDVDGEKMFSLIDDDAPRTDLTDWVSFAHATESDSTEGLVFTKSPGLLLNERSVEAV